MTSGMEMEIFRKDKTEMRKYKFTRSSNAISGFKYVGNQSGIEIVSKVETLIIEKLSNMLGHERLGTI